MVPVLGYAGDRVLIMGLGKSGLSAAQALRDGGAQVTVWDDNPAARQAAAAKGWPLLESESASLEGLRRLIWSPGVPHTLPKPHPLAARARAAEIPLACDVDLLLEASADPEVIAVTGTNGKSTTTTLIGHLLRHAGRKAAAGGNLGTPALELEPLGLGGAYVLELSSYQLELVPHLAAQIAVLLNITPDHLDRHGGMDGYIAAKRRIFDHQRHPRVAVIGVDDAPSAAMAASLRADGLHRVVPISVRQPAPGGVYVDGTLLIDATDTRPAKIIDLREVSRLPGAHNWQNAAAATAVARCHGLTGREIAAGLKSFAGLKHRQELIAVVDGVAFVNDSKATNADAAENALRCYENIYWIAGGRAKEGGIASLSPLFPRIRHAYLIGEAADDFADTLEGKVPFTLFEDMETAIEDAGTLALREKRPGATVLLSPACASFDMFKNFEDRGDVFRSEVEALWPAPKASNGP